MTTSSFAQPARLPVFIDGQRMPVDLWANGCIYHQQIYDGFRNKVEITPLISPPGWLYPTIPVGESYTIGERDLQRRLTAL